MRKILSTALAAVTLAGSMIAVTAPVEARDRDQFRRHGYSQTPRNWDGNRRWSNNRHWNGHRYAYRHRHYDGGSTIGAGILGFTAGALIGNAISGQYQYSSTADACAARFRSYDRASGTYLGYDGARHACP